MTDKLSQTIIDTLAYFAVFDYPVTAEELYKSLWKFSENLAYFDFLAVLEKMKQEREIGFLGSYFFLKNKEEGIFLREQAISVIEKKMSIAKKGIKKIAWLPFVKAVFVCNTLAEGTAKEDSDIDLFIVVKEGRLWLTRLLITLILSILRLRRVKNKIKDRLCLSFYITDKNLNLVNYTIEPEDAYLVYWILFLIPIYDPENFRKKIIEDNAWLHCLLTNDQHEFFLSKEWQIKLKSRSSKIKLFLEKIWEGGYGNLMEKQAKEAQLFFMKLKSKEPKKNDGKGVIINDNILKFHENDRREFYHEEWKKNRLSVFNNH